MGIRYFRSGQMDLSDRIAIEAGIGRKDTFKQIAKLLGRHPSTIAREIQQNRTFIEGSYCFGKDCKFVRRFHERHICGNQECDRNCCKCLKFKCTSACSKYVPTKCHKFEKPPYVCNNCSEIKLCYKDKYIYSAKYADATVNRRRSESRQGIRTTGDTMKQMDTLVTELVKKGQPLTHIYANHSNELPVSLRTLYNYIDSGSMTVKNIDLRRKTGYRPRKKGRQHTLGFSNMEFRQLRMYADFENALKAGGFCVDEVVEMDTVRGSRESGKRLLTMIFRANNVMLLFLMPDGKAESVKRVFDYLEAGLGVECFRKLFPVILTDNGSEFKRVDDLELTVDFSYRTHIYYCDPMASWQKGCIEKNHEYIRYAIPKGKSLNPYTQADITILMNHINSIKRSGLGNRSPYDLIQDSDECMLRLMALLKMHPIPPDEVHVKPDFLKHT